MHALMNLAIAHERAEELRRGAESHARRVRNPRRSRPSPIELLARRVARARPTELGAPSRTGTVRSG